MFAFEAIIFPIYLQDGESSLHIAAARGYLDSVKTLLDSGAPINQVDKVQLSFRLLFFQYISSDAKNIKLIAKNT